MFRKGSRTACNESRVQPLTKKASASARCSIEKRELPFKPMTTNRDVYLAVAKLSEQGRESLRTLEEYLRSLIRAIQPYENVAYLTSTQFTDVLAQALVGDALPFDPVWESNYNKNIEDTGFDSWRATIRRQVVDLRDMAAAGTFENTMRYFGVTSPRGTLWYNFDIGTYLECAAVGSLGGWEPGDATGRELVPGPVAVLEPDGSISSRNAGEIRRPLISMDRVAWARFTRFLECGQLYE